MLDFVKAVAPRSWLASAHLTSLPEPDLGQRETIRISALLEIGGRLMNCNVVELSARTACVYLSEFIGAHDTFVGQMGLLRKVGGQAVSVTVRSFTDMSLNLKFLSPVGPEAFGSPVDGFRAEVRRSERAQVQIRSQIIAGDEKIPGTILNISVGGALVRTDTACNPTGAIMLQSETLRPMGGYIRWRNETLLGIMFNRPLSMFNAEDIADNFNVSPLWLDEISELHGD
jgi:hypothetical protein